MQTNDSVVEAVLFTPVAKILHDDNIVINIIGEFMSILHFDNVTKIGILHVLIPFVFISSLTLARLR